MIRAGNTSRATGFTMIEVLVAISVIAVLAAIVLAGYSAIQNRTLDAAVQSDLASNIKTLTQYYSNNSVYPTEAQLASISPKLGFSTTSYLTTSNAVLYCRSADGASISLIGASKTGNVYYVTNKARVPVTLGVSFPQGQATDCTNTGITDPSNGTAGGWIHTSAGGWDSWVQ